MIIRELLQSVRQQLGSNGDFLGAELLLAFVLGKNREFLLTHDDVEISDSDMNQFYELFDRMVKGEPVAYLLGHKEFFGLDFFVDSRVLIPRPETEHLVEWIVKYVKNRGDSANILDVGTGSGCIAIALAKNLPNIYVTGIDISSDAITVAKKNAEHNNVQNAQFFQSDLLEKVQQPFDIVVANLPYIGEKRFSFVSKSARDYEPHVALFGGDDGLQLYHKFFVQLAAMQWRPKLLLGEFGFLQTEELRELFLKVFPDNAIRFEQDYANIDRMFVVDFSGVASDALS